MPRVDWNLEATWAAHYSDRQGDYSRAFYKRQLSGHWPGLRRALPAISPADRVLVVGCGFGGLIEVAHDDGYPSVWGVESSAWISGKRSAETLGSVLFVEDDALGGERVRAALDSLTGDRVFDWVLTESILESFEDAELPALYSALDAFLFGAERSRIAHLVVTDRRLNPVFNVKPLAGWKATEPAHSFVSVNGYQVL